MELEGTLSGEDWEGSSEEEPEVLVPDMDSTPDGVDETEGGGVGESVSGGLAWYGGVEHVGDAMWGGLIGPCGETKGVVVVLEEKVSFWGDEGLLWVLLLKDGLSWICVGVSVASGLGLVGTVCGSG